MGSKNGLVMDRSSLPDISLNELDFHDTTFFRTPVGAVAAPAKLPTPAAVRDEWQRQDRPYVVKVMHMNLVVKFGAPHNVRLEEAQTMRAIRQLFPENEVPVPELFGWRVDQGQNFLYMSLVQGSVLFDTWVSLIQAEKLSIRDHLGGIVAALRRIQQDPSDLFVDVSTTALWLNTVTKLRLGSINRGKVQDT